MMPGPVKKQFSISSLQWRGLQLCLFALSMHGLKDKRIIYVRIPAKVAKRELPTPHRVVQQLHEQPGHLWSVLLFFLVLLWLCLWLTLVLRLLHTKIEQNHVHCRTELRVPVQIFSKLFWFLWDAQPYPCAHHGFFQGRQGWKWHL